MPRDATEGHHARQRANGVGSPAETNQEDPIAIAIKADQGGVAIDDVCGDAKAGCHAGKIVNLACPLDFDPRAISWRAQSWIIERNLLRGIDGRIRPDAAGPIELVNIGSYFIEGDSSGLARSIREDNDVL